MGKVTFEDSKTQSQGSAIYADNVYIRSGAEITFKNNDSTLGGPSSYTSGAIYCDDFVLEEGATVIFEGNKGTAHGGAIYGATAKGELITLSGTAVFKDNSAKSGGAISTCFIKIDGDVDFIGNEAAGNGGAIEAKSSASYKGNIEVSGTVNFTDNTTTGNGGALWSDGTITFTGTDSKVTFSGNADQNGANDVVAASNVTFQDNGEFTFGGGIDSKSGNLTINDTASVTLAAGSESNIAGGVETTGTLLIDGNLNAYQDVAVKNGGTIGGSGNVTGDVTLDKGATLQLGVDKDGNAKTLDVTGEITLNEESKIEIVVDEGYLPSHGQTFDMPILNNIKVDTQKDDFDLNTLLSGDAASWFILSVGEDGNLTAGVNPSYVPEPTTWVLMILGFAGLACLRKRNQ